MGNVTAGSAANDGPQKTSGKTRNTAQLSIVRDALRALADHPTADEVYGYIHREHPSISKATVYRTLNKLVSQNEAAKVYTAQGADRFDHITRPHAHVQCQKCGAVMDVEVTIDQAISQKAADSCGFSISTAHVQFLGLCPECQAAENG